jgi:hypothetical protein
LLYVTFWLDNIAERFGADNARERLADPKAKYIIRLAVELRPAANSDFTGPLLPFGVQSPGILLQFQELGTYTNLMNSTNCEGSYLVLVASIISSAISAKPTRKYILY